jgi:uncharacterized protein (DUF697 family)
MPSILVAQGYSLTSSLAFTMIMNLGSLLGACAAAALARRVPRRVVVVRRGRTRRDRGGRVRPLRHRRRADPAARRDVQFFALTLNTTLAAWSPELYPTEVRALGTSLVNGIGNVAGAVMPLLAVVVFATAGVAGMFTMLAVMYVQLEDPELAVKAVVHEAELAVRLDRAEVICLGCGGMAGLDDAVRAQTGVPVVDGVTAAVKLAESLVALGLSTSKVRTYAPPPAKRVVGWPLTSI